MTVKYTNQQGQLFFLHKKLTKRGNFRYYFSKDDKLNLEEKIPESYEIYENPMGQVFLRKKNKNFISEEDVKIVERAVAEYTDFEHFYIDTQKNSIVLYLPDIDLEEISGTLSVTMIGDEIKLNQFSPGSLTYSPFIKFVHTHKSKKYTLEKVDTNDTLKRWLKIDTSDDLNNLIINNITHFKNSTYSKLKILFL